MVQYLNVSDIEWCDLTWNPEKGCRNDCPYCYAKALSIRFQKPWGLNPEDPFEPRFYPERLDAPMKLKKPSKIFVCSMGELWGPWVPQEWQWRVMTAITKAKHHTFLNLTKNPKGLLAWEAHWASTPSWIRRPFPFYPPNLWLGVSVDTQDAVGRIDALRAVEHPNKFVSFEPLLEDVAAHPEFSLEGIKWVIIGQQTGPRAVHAEAPWVFHISDAAYCEGIPRFYKDNLPWQWYERPRDYPEGMP